jgi:hypothetical protein
MVTKVTSNYRGTSVLSTAYNILPNILLSRLTQNVSDRQYGFRRNGSTTVQIFCASQILEKEMEVKWDSTSAIYRLQEISGPADLPVTL